MPRLGLSGYNAFKLALAQADRTTDLGDSSNSAEPVSSEDSISTICAKVHAANLLSLNESYALYDEEEMSKAISILSSSRRIYCFGQGGSMIMAMEAWARFSTASPNFVHICDSHMQAVQLQWLIQKMPSFSSLIQVLPEICVIPYR